MTEAERKAAEMRSIMRIAMPSEEKKKAEPEKKPAKKQGKKAK